MKKVKDAARIDRIKYAAIPEDGSDIIEFGNLDDMREYMYQNPQLKYFYAFDVNSEDIVFKVRRCYMERYTVRDIKDRLMAIKAGNNFNAKY